MEVRHSAAKAMDPRREPQINPIRLQIAMDCATRKGYLTQLRIRFQASSCK